MNTEIKVGDKIKLFRRHAFRDQILTVTRIRKSREYRQLDILFFTNPFTGQEIEEYRHNTIKVESENKNE